ncbi:hypothetical protein BCR35DRAFT_269698, partial [Leucosporidium creatinivorum]
MVTTLASLLSLDAPTVKEQILPYMTTLRSASEVESYLDTLLPPGPPSQAFIRNYLSLRFPPPPPPPGSPAATPPAVSRSTTPQLPPPVPEPTRKPSPAPSTSTSRARKGEDPAQAVVDLSEAASVEMLQVDRALRSLTSKSKSSAVKGCFCQARLHPLSSYIPLCPSCALVLCTLNAPISPCPSCLHAPLLPSSSITSHIASLQSQRSAIIERETRRVEREREEEERERRAIRFPGLGDPSARLPGQGAGGRRGYADLVGGGAGGIEERIERGYRE